MKIYPVRSALFMLSFFIVVGTTCVACLPTLVLPRKYYLWVVDFFGQQVYFLERFILGLDFEVRGIENVPSDGSSYLVAAKHESAYETFKLRLLFEDPAIILKKELLRIPLWGWYLKKSDVIAIDRSTPDSAMSSIAQGAQRMKDHGRPIIIFPQGTRVRIDETTQDKPYKSGIARIQQQVNLPIVPMALNSGYFWPRNSWLKRPGKIVFEFLPPIPAGALEKKDLMATLESRLEGASQRLLNEARDDVKSYDEPRGFPFIRVGLLILFAVIYSGIWFYTADLARTQYLKYMDELVEEDRLLTAPIVSGFPGPITLSVAEEYIQSSEGTLRVHDLQAKGWPLPFIPIHIETGVLEVHSFKWAKPLIFESLDGHLSVRGPKILKINDSKLTQGDFEAGAEGTIDFNQEPVPRVDMTITMKNHQPFMMILAQEGIMEERAALFGSAALAMFEQDGVVSVPVTQSGQTLYAGPLPVLTLPEK